MQKSLRDRKIAQGPIKQTSSSLIPLVVTGIVAVALGMVTSVWIWNILFDKLFAIIFNLIIYFFIHSKYYKWNEL